MNLSKAQKNKMKKSTIALLAVMFLLLTSCERIYVSYHLENDLLLNEKIAEKDARYLAFAHVLSKPDIEGRQFFGSDEAEINVIAYIDPQSEKSFKTAEVLEQIKAEYADTNIVRIYPKHYLTPADIEQKTERYIKAMQIE